MLRGASSQTNQPNTRFFAQSEATELNGSKGFRTLLLLVVAGISVLHCEGTNSHQDTTKSPGVAGSSIGGSGGSAGITNQAGSAGAAGSAGTSSWQSGTATMVPKWHTGFVCHGLCGYNPATPVQDGDLNVYLAIRMDGPWTMADGSMHGEDETSDMYFYSIDLENGKFKELNRFYPGQTGYSRQFAKRDSGALFAMSYAQDTTLDPDTTLHLEVVPNAEPQHNWFMGLVDAEGQFESTLSLASSSFYPAIGWGGSNRSCFAGAPPVTLTVNEMTSIEASDVGVVCYGPTNEWLWTRSLNAFASTVNAMAVTVQNRVIVAGSYFGSLSIGEQTWQHPLETPSYFLAAFDEKGSTEWVKDIPLEQTCSATIIEGGTGNADNEQGVFFAMTCEGAIDLGIGAKGNNGVSATHLAKLDTTGAVIWHKVLDLPEPYPNIASDGKGGVYLGGSFTGTVTLGNAQMESVGKRDAFLAQIDQSGDITWSLRFGDKWDDTVDALLVTDQGLLLQTNSWPESTGTEGSPLYTLVTIE